MKVTVAAVVPKRFRSKSGASEELLADYIKRSGRYLSCSAEIFDSEEDLLKKLDRKPGRTQSSAILLDSRGKQLSSEELAVHFGRLRDSGTQQVVFAVGPADGWSPAALERADFVLSLGRITLPHQLARVVLAEQVYRALTILSGHPYHSGH